MNGLKYVFEVGLLEEWKVDNRNGRLASVMGCSDVRCILGFPCCVGERTTGQK